MLVERIESEGLAHYSYLIGDKNEAIIIDPRRDSEIYRERLVQSGLQLTNILETHCNEDYLIGSLELAADTGAEIWHADSQSDYQYGLPVQDGQTWKVGRLNLRAIHSPGHTPGSMSYLLHDPDGAPWIIFTGDALFAGGVGRVDLLGDERIEEMAGLLYETLFRRLLPLGDGIIVCPAHGSGSVCGSAISERTWTTIGLERRVNPKLQYRDKARFVAHMAKKLGLPPYFQRMEKLNVKGPPILNKLPLPIPLSPEEFAQRAQDGIILDTRLEMNFCTVHIPNALSIWLDGLPAYAGWFLPYDRPILLVNETDDPTQAARHLTRLGYDQLAGYLSGGILAWLKEGRDVQSLEGITVQGLCRRFEANEDTWVLDVRSGGELEKEGKMKNSHHIPITQLLNRLGEVPRDSPVHVLCDSGLRSTTAASLLQREGWSRVTMIWGGWTSWKSAQCLSK